MTEGPLLWYLNRATGVVLLVLLTLSVVLGVLAMGGRPGRGLPRFVTQAMHRNLALLSVAALVAHVVTAVVDSYVDIGWWQAVVPAGATTSPLAGPGHPLPRPAGRRGRDQPAPDPSRPPVLADGPPRCRGWRGGRPSRTPSASAPTSAARPGGGAASRRLRRCGRRRRGGAAAPGSRRHLPPTRDGVREQGVTGPAPSPVPIPEQVRIHPVRPAVRCRRRPVARGAPGPVRRGAGDRAGCARRAGRSCRAPGPRRCGLPVRHQARGGRPGPPPGGGRQPQRGRAGQRQGRALALSRPHLVLDGAAATARALGAREVHVVLPGRPSPDPAPDRQAVRERDDGMRCREHTADARFVAGQARAVVELMAGRPNLRSPRGRRKRSRDIAADRRCSPMPRPGRRSAGCCMSGRRRTHGSAPPTSPAPPC